MDARHDETGARDVSRAHYVHAQAATDRRPARKDERSRWFRPVRDDGARRRRAFGQMRLRLVR